MKKLLLTIMILTSTSQALALGILALPTETVALALGSLQSFFHFNKDSMKYESSLALADTSAFNNRELNLSAELRIFVDHIKELNSDLLLSDRDVLEEIVLL